MALNWSFKARLHNASDTMKKRYGAVCDELASYKGLKTSESWDKVRIYSGRTTYGALIFRGKTLCVALALNPADYAETKYVFEDISATAKFAAMPMLMRMSSDRQVKYLAELLDGMFDGMDRIAAEKTVVDAPFYTKEELVEMKLIKVTSKKSKAVEEEDEEPVPQKVAATKAKEPEPVKEPAPVEEPVPEPAPAPEVVEKPKKAEPKKQPKEKPVVYEIPQNVPSAPKGIVNLSALNGFEAGSVVTPQALKDKGLICPCVNNLKVLNGGCLTKPLTVAASEFSAAAKAAIEKIGGTVVRIPVVK